MKILIRPATEKDSRFIAWLILAAGRSGRPTGFWDVYLDKNEIQILDFLEKLTTTKVESLCHWSKFIIAEKDSNPVAGLACLYPRNATGEVFKEAIYEVFDLENWSNDDREAAKRRAIPHFACFPKLPDDAWVIEWVACLPEFQRKGIIQKLLQGAIEKGKACHAQLFQVCVATGNIPAERAYIKAGFQFIDSKESKVFEKIFNYKGLSRYLIDQR